MSLGQNYQKDMLETTAKKGTKFIKSVFSTMNYLLYGAIALTGTRPLTRPFIQRTKGGQMENVSCFYFCSISERDRNNELNARYTVTKRLAVFPSPAGMSLTKLFLVGNNFPSPAGMSLTKLFLVGNN